jgi:chromosome segregation ATPase
VVMTPRETWTDERLDEFKASVNQRFDEVDRRFDEVDKRLDRMDDDIRELRQAVGRMSESMNRNFIALAMLVVAAVVFF